MKRYLLSIILCLWWSYAGAYTNGFIGAVASGGTPPVVATSACVGIGGGTGTVTVGIYNSSNALVAYTPAMTITTAGDYCSNINASVNASDGAIKIVVLSGGGGYPWIRCADSVSQIYRKTSVVSLPDPLAGASASAGYIEPALWLRNADNVKVIGNNTYTATTTINSDQLYYHQAGYSW